VLLVVTRNLCLVVMRKTLLQAEDPAVCTDLGGDPALHGEESY